MIPGPWSWLFEHLLRRPARAVARFVRQLIEALKIPPPDAPVWIRRITLMERDLVLPVKAATISMVLYFYLRPWVGRVNSALDVEVDATKSFFWFYISLNIVVAGLLLMMRRVPMALLQWVVFATSLMDGIFLSALTLVTGGYNSILFWLFLGLIIRSSVSVPRATSQILLNLTLSACYILTGIVDVYVAQNLTEQARSTLHLSEPPDNPAEPLALRVMLLLFMTFSCYGVQVLLERQRRAEEEAREFAVRQGQLHSAARLAAEFAHQIKNPLAIINTTLFSLRRMLKDNHNPAVTEQLEMIQEEVEHSDRIITEVMGYAQLNEGRVERLNVLEELDRALDEVLPPAAQFPVKAHRDYGQGIPILYMHRRHFYESILNVLQNGREALGQGGGNLFVSARYRDADRFVEIVIRDDGPGIPPEKLERIFEAYYTTKEKGTGLGLAVVKHNVELYGGQVKVESELGKGARFILSFPAKTQMTLAKTL
jgi:signal transduction histidine kinase